MPNSWLLDTNYNGGLQETHYFDGRLLTADALKADQDAIQTRLNWLGNAAGAGAWGSGNAGPGDCLRESRR